MKMELTWHAVVSGGHYVVVLLPSWSMECGVIAGAQTAILGIPVTLSMDARKWPSGDLEDGRAQRQRSLGSTSLMEPLDSLPPDIFSMKE